jgi:hypothetical protein
MSLEDLKPFPNLLPLVYVVRDTERYSAHATNSGFSLPRSRASFMGRSRYRALSRRRASARLSHPSRSVTYAGTSGFTIFREYKGKRLEATPILSRNSSAPG